jgi:probable HAF family extracellular repeat protein
MRNISSFLLIAAAVGCNNEAPVTEPAEPLATHRSGPRYDVAKFSSTLGGRVSVGTSISSRGWVAGYSNDDGDGTRHAALWRHGKILDLGTLGGPNSAVLWPGQNDRGMVVGVAETQEMDPNEEAWSCSAFFPSVTHHVCRGFVWYDGEMKPLPTLGGTHGFATGVNNRGQVVGWAETPIEDPTCTEPQDLQFRAVLWEPRKRRHRQLPPLHGDSTSAATAINDRGQVVGISGECDVAVGQLSAQHAVIWEHGMVKRIPDLGGEAWHTPMAINDRGQVVGFSNPSGVPGIEFLPLGFIWTRSGGTRQLDQLDGDDFSQAFGINERGVVVGRSCGPTGCRAVIWENRVVKDLNDLIPPNYPHVLTAARDINDAGVITGNLVKQGTDTNLTFVAVPRGKP